MTDLWIFVGALAVAYLIPGPDMVLILHTGVLQGRAYALAVAIGLALARAIQVFLAAAGLAALLRTAPWSFEAVRIAGAAYLIWLGIGILRSRSLSPEGPGPTASDDSRAWSHAMVRGLLTNLLNPKALLFCSVLLPQFVRPENGSGRDSSCCWERSSLPSASCSTSPLPALAQHSADGTLGI